MLELSKDELWKIYDLLPEDLKDAIFSENTADNISLASQMAGIDDERVSKVAKLTGQVLMGLVAPDEFELALIKEAELSQEQARKVSHQIQRLVFNPVKESLAVLYGEKKEKTQQERPEVEKAEVAEEEIEQKPGTKSESKSKYLEPIE